MKFETVIGLEIHVELATKSKIFCSCTTEFGGTPNSHCCPICTGMPGVLPVLNKSVVEYAVKTGIALGCEIQKYNRFDRKNYFYPDLPKAYQISQLYLPFARNGCVEISVDGCNKKNIRIHEIHMEEDAGKLIHSETGDATYIDYNRCGVPLIEIVTEPDFRSSEEVIAFLAKIKSMFEYMDVSDCKMQEGSMRVDVNLSVREFGDKELGTRTEMKNLNSFKGIERAINSESQRQINLISSGERVIQETRRWDDTKGRSFSMRTKENANDYRYFPEPDIPPLMIDNNMLIRLTGSLPEFAEEKAERFTKEYFLSKADSLIIASSKHLAQLFEQTVIICRNPKEVRYWLLGQVMYLLKEKAMTPDEITLTPQKFAEFVNICSSERINRQAGKTVFENMFFADDSFDIENFITENSLEQVDDANAIRNAVLRVLAENPNTVEQFKSGQTKVFGFFVGQVMKVLKGKAKPDSVNKIIKEELNKL